MNEAYPCSDELRFWYDMTRSKLLSPPNCPTTVPRARYPGPNGEVAALSKYGWQGPGTASATGAGASAMPNDATATMTASTNRPTMGLTNRDTMPTIPCHVAPMHQCAGVYSLRRDVASSGPWTEVHVYLQVWLRHTGGTARVQIGQGSHRHPDAKLPRATWRLGYRNACLQPTGTPYRRGATE